MSQLSSEQIQAQIAALDIPREVELELAVKTQSTERIIAAAHALAALSRPILLAHNRVQEAAQTIPQVRAALTQPVQVSLIGPLQSNKINQALTLVDEIETVASAEQAEAIAKRVERDYGAGHQLGIWLQVNVSGEDTKAGCQPSQAETIADQIANLGLDLRGLMTIGLNSSDSAAVARGYQALARLGAKIVATHPRATGLSMGMSGDYRLAIECGATRVRIGSSVFGARH